MEPDYFRDEQDEKDFEAEIPLDEEEEEEAQRTTVSENLSTEEVSFSLFFSCFTSL